MVVSVAPEHHGSRPDVYAAVIRNPEREGRFSILVLQYKLAVLHQDFVILGRDRPFGTHHAIFPDDEQPCGPQANPRLPASARLRPDANLDW
jgi:hypothetical protein